MSRLTCSVLGIPTKHPFLSKLTSVVRHIHHISYPTITTLPHSTYNQSTLITSSETQHIPALLPLIPPPGGWYSVPYNSSRRSFANHLRISTRRISHDSYHHSISSYRPQRKIKGLKILSYSYRRFNSGNNTQQDRGTIANTTPDPTRSDSSTQESNQTSGDTTNTGEWSTSTNENDPSGTMGNEYEMSGRITGKDELETEESEGGTPVGETRVNLEEISSSNSTERTSEVQVNEEDDAGEFKGRYTGSTQQNLKVENSEEGREEGKSESENEGSLKNRWKIFITSLGETSERFVEVLNKRLNVATGYDEVERLKKIVMEKEHLLSTLRAQAKEAKQTYSQAVLTQSSAQRKVNTLLERKHLWTDSDVSLFAHLVRLDHSSSSLLTQSTLNLSKAEENVDKAFTDLMQGILERYHSEQMWSDKIRGVATWVNVLGLILNLIVFIGAVVFVEPWKRARLVERLEERGEMMWEKVESGLKGLEGEMKLVRGFQGLEGMNELTKLEGERMGVESLEMKVGNDGKRNLGMSQDEVMEFSGKGEERNLILSRINWIPEKLSKWAIPSHERDCLVFGLGGMIGGIVIMAFTTWASR
ncbi:hypothetical protein M231_03560 [Tremella mesenterica]|uniref:Sensitive to high expression protein 9, mitochondrial n=1 Tax=Tremella mesenterica TaxID=5217 RepID=A0A4Q1BMY1_TREME|nr:hypothetical protein M231_03560 [Tremella mesenterica]